MTDIETGSGTFFEVYSAMIMNAPPDSVIAVSCREEEQKWVIVLELHTECKKNDHQGCVVIGEMISPPLYNTQEEAKKAGIKLGEILAKLSGATPEYGPGADIN